jgi:hypothetical protein
MLVRASTYEIQQWVIPPQVRVLHQLSPSTASAFPMITRLSLILLGVGVVMPALLVAQPPGAQSPRSARFSFLMRKPEFRKDLEIVDEQRKEIQSIHDERSKFLGSSNPAEMTAEQRQAFALTVNDRMAEFDRREEEVLLPHQRRRLAQLRLQELTNAQGMFAGLNHPRMTETLKLSDEQVERIKATAQETDAKLKEKIAKLEREIKLARDEARQRILGELSDQQRRLYSEALGPIADYSLR